MTANYVHSYRWFQFVAEKSSSHFRSLVLFMIENWVGTYTDLFLIRLEQILLIDNIEQLLSMKDIRNIHSILLENIPNYYVFSLKYYQFVSERLEVTDFEDILDHMIYNNNLHYEPILIRLEIIMRFKNIDELIFEEKKNYILDEILAPIQTELYATFS